MITELIPLLVGVSLVVIGAGSQGVIVAVCLPESLIVVLILLRCCFLRILGENSITLKS